MKKQQVVIGGSYLAKVSGKVAPVRITGESRFGGWDAVNTETNKAVRVKSAQRLRRPADAKTKAALQAVAGKAADNILLRVEPGQFTFALNRAAIGELEDALKLECWSARQRSRIEAALANRRNITEAIADGQKAAAENVAKTVEAVAKGDLGKGVEVPMPAKRGHGRRLKQAEAEQQAEAQPGGKVTMSKADAVDAAMKAVAADKKKRASGLDAAAKVLAEAGQPLNAKQIVEAMAAKGYWSSDAATPQATIYAGMLIETRKKGSASRFVKVDRGLWTLAAAGKQAK